MHRSSNLLFSWGRNLSIIFIVAVVSILTSCGDTAEVADSAGEPETPAQVVEAFYKSLDSENCPEALQHLIYVYEASPEQRSEIEVFIKNTASQSAIETLEAEIRNMQEVDTLTFISKDEALEQLKNSLGENSDILDELKGNPLPAYFLITVKDPATAGEVASRFFNNPIVDNTPGSYPSDGIRYMEKTSAEIEQAVNESCRLVLSAYDYQVLEFNVINESIEYDEAVVTFNAVVSIDGAESNPSEYTLILNKLGNTWKIDFFDSLWSLRRPTDFFGLLLINNEAQGKKINDLIMGTSRTNTLTETAETITTN